MPSPKALILQGILGVAGLCASGVGGIGLGLGKAFKGVQSDAPSATNSADEPVNDQQNTEGEVDGDLGIPEECEGSCSLSAEQLKKLKFEVKKGSSIEFEGLGGSDEFELIIEESSDQINYPKNKKYILKPKTISGTVTIKNVEEGDIVLGKDQEVLIREVVGGGKLEHLLEEVTELGIPKRCVGDQATQACELTQHQLEKLNFETRENEKISVEGLGEGNLVTLKIEDKGDDGNNYPKGKKYILTSATGPVTIKGIKEGDIVLESGKEVLIRETSSGGKLEHLIEEVDRLGIPKRCNADEVTGGTKTECQLTQKQLKVLKFEPKEGSSIAVDGQDDNSKFILEIEDKPSDEENYPRGKKYTIKSTGTIATIQNVKEGNIHIWKNLSVVVREKETGGKLEKAPEEVNYLGIPVSCTPGRICSLTEYQIKNLKFEVGDDGIKVEGIKEAKTVSLTVEDKSNDRDNYPKGKKYTLSAGKTVTIKGLKDGDIEIGTNGGVVIREKETGEKLEKAPEEIDHLLIPKRCNSGSTCQLTKEELQRIKFETNHGSSITVEGLEEGKKVDLKVETTSDLTHYPKLKKYILKATSGEVTIQNTKDGNIVLEANKGVVFRETNSGRKLETYLNVLGIPRAWGGEDIKSGSDPETYYLSSDQLKDLRFKAFEGGSGEVKVTGLERGEKIKLTISWSDDVNKYPDHKKYSFDNTEKDKNIKISKGGQEITIAKHKESWFGNKEGKLEFAETKTKSQIESEKKIKELMEILKQIGLEKLTIGDLVVGSPIKRQQTNVEFKNAEDLKKIQFKALGGSADYTSSSNFRGLQKITVYLDWDDDARKFPKNMKFLFENPTFEAPGFEFKKGYKNTVIIYKKERPANPDNRKNTFKLENYKGKWYLVRTDG